MQNYVWRSGFRSSIRGCFTANKQLRFFSTKTTESIQKLGLAVVEELLLDRVEMLEYLKSLQMNHLKHPLSEKIFFDYIEALRQAGFDDVILETAENLNLRQKIIFFYTENNYNVIYSKYNKFGSFGYNFSDLFQRRKFIKKIAIFALLFNFGSLLKWPDSDDEEDEKSNKDEDDDQSWMTKDESLFGKIGQNISPNNFQIKDKPNVTFKDLIGIDEFKAEVEEILDFLKNPEKFIEAGAEMPKGILLHGKPGVGKTEMARALACEANCNFFYATGSDFNQTYVGMGSMAIRSLFKSARKNSPSIIFIDELDAVAGDRSKSLHSWQSGEINQLLTEMDGFDTNHKIIVVGATNLVSSLDKAILRPGRFDKIIEIPLPDSKARKLILEYYKSKIKTQGDIDVEAIAGRTTGMTGADIKNLVNIAILNSLKNNRLGATSQDFEFSLDRMLIGITRKHLAMSDNAKLKTAYHEGGHTLMSLLTNPGMRLHKVTILPAGPSLGHTAFVPMEDESDMQLSNMLSLIDVAMGGRVAEELIYGSNELTTGWSQDLKQATNIAKELVRNMGYSQKSNITLSSDKDKLSEFFNKLSDQEIESILRESLARTRKVLAKNKNLLDILARNLLKKETMTVDEIKELLKMK